MRGHWIFLRLTQSFSCINTDHLHIHMWKRSRIGSDEIYRCYASLTLRHVLFIRFLTFCMIMMLHLIVLFCVFVPICKLSFFFFGFISQVAVCIQYKAIASQYFELDQCTIAWFFPGFVLSLAFLKFLVLLQCIRYVGFSYFRF